MKKIIGIALILIFGSVAALSADTWTNIAGLGWNLPMDETFNANGYNNGEDIVLENQTGLNAFYMGVHKCGFAVKADSNLNYSGINHEMNNVPYIGVNESIQIGAGFAPVHSENVTIALFGMAGLDVSAFYSTSSWTDTAANEKITAEYEEGQVAFMVGGNITAMYTPTKHFSVFASCSVNRVLQGLYEFEADFSDVYADSEDTYITNPTIKIMPTVGVCWKF